MNISLTMLKQVRDALVDAGAPKTLLVGVSGGADSMALLRLLCALRAEMEMSVHVVHVRHDLREQAEADAQFVIAACACLSVPCAVQRVHVPRRGSLEDAARAVRYQAFEAEYQRLNADALVLAHHRDDQAETVLLHLTRGGGAKGLSGMRPVSHYEGMRVIRPLLNASRAELRLYLETIGQPFCEDQTNADTHYTRNFLRAEVFPLLNAKIPGATEACARAAGIMADEDDCLTALTNNFLLRNACLSPPCPFLLREPFLELPVALQRRALRALCEKTGGLSLAQTDTAVKAALESGKTVNLPANYRLLTTKTRLHLLPPQDDAEKLPLQMDDWLRVAPFEKDMGDGRTTQVISRQILSQAVLRTRQAGDFIRPFGQNGKTPLKEYLIDHGVDRPFRAHVPLLCRGNEVLFALGVGASEALRFSLKDASVILTVSHRLPWEI